MVSYALDELLLDLNSPTLLYVKKFNFYI